MKRIVATLVLIVFAISCYAAAGLSRSEIKSGESGKLTDEEAQLFALRAKDNQNLNLKEKDLLTVSNLNQSGKYEEAEALSQKISKRDMELIQEYQEFLKKYPKNFVAHNDLGNLFYDIAYLDSAYEEWLQSASINPNYAPAFNNIGVWHSHDGSPEVAIRSVQKAIELGPQQASFHFNLATFYYTFRPNALEILECDLPKLFEIILREHKYAVQLAPNDYDYAYNYAYTFFGYGLFKAALNWKEAEDAWLYLLKIRPSDRQTPYHFLTMLALNAGLKEEAGKYLKLLKEVDTSGSAIIKRFEERLKEMDKK